MDKEKTMSDLKRFVSEKRYEIIVSREDEWEEWEDFFFQ